MEKVAEKRPMSATGCRKHLRDTVREQFPEITAGFVKKARTGSVPHLKLATEILGVPKQGTRRKKGLMDAVLKELREKQAKEVNSE